MSDPVAASAAERTPQGTLTLQTVPMPADTNSGGDVFGGWVVSQMDIAAGTTAMDRAQGRCATVAIEALRFHAPVLVGDLFSVYSQITRTGRTSITMHIEAWVRRQRTGERMLVTEGDFTFVAISESGVTRPLPPEEAQP
ncbi:acyl-CoA thioesterase [Roseicyclus marinus]|uniref:acyl-CoA thioesterase n=1 Tax=Roseicyclus marinus TaxID=2161673 RepID=UPI00240FD75E|nr:acyl-CoA thioesterase [Roseicyclus marinus]MDG3042056.1 acyl-CoA thioesterase [Roseicyclus marinus]